MKTYLTLFILALFTFSRASFAQENPGSINGTVLDEKNQPLEYASVSLLNSADQKLVKGGLTTEGGKFVLSQIKTGNYLIEASVIGYKKSRSEKFSVAAGQTVKVKAITLALESKSLNEVTVTGTRPLIERKSDRTVLNVENSALAAGNNALEILQRAPGVTLDKDDNISLRGKQGVTVMIDGKLTYLSSTQLAALLRSTDGNSIAQVEIITNPSAKYDAAGNSGIINIKTKKNKTSGTNGSLTAGAGYGLNHKANTSLNVNHKSGRVNVFGTYSYMDNKWTRDFGLDRLVSFQNVTTRFNQNAQFNQNYRSNSAKAGIDIEISKKNTLGFQATTNLNHELGNNPSNTLIGNQAGRVDSTLSTLSNFDQHYRNFSLNLNDKITFDSLGRELTFDVDYSRFNNSNDSRYANYYYNANGAVAKDPLFLRSGAPSVIDIRTAKADYTHPFSKTLKLEAGVKTSFVETD
ncbi:MAG: outer membrane beta-barrel protein, partial [Mucilaginibacter polytrichastri]|nr:outer membrane beta-barrel protein [Mucilaginibacter polytrichastri]